MPRVVPFGPTGKAQRTRYKPDMFMHNGRPEVLISAERKRELDAEAICERFSPRFISQLRLMDHDKAAVVEVLVAGLFYADDEALDRAEAAGTVMNMKRKAQREKPGTDLRPKGRR